MGFFDAFTGAAQGRDIKKGYAKATDELEQGYTDALASLRSGYGDADRLLRSGYGDLNRAQGALTAGERAALGDLDPYLTSGRQAVGLLDDALGLNGLDRQRAFGQHYAAYDPFRELNARFATEDLMAALNARGLSGSGYGAEAVAQQSLRRGAEDYQNYLSRLESARGSGLQAATTASGLRGDFAGKRANLYESRATLGKDRAGLAKDRGNALAELGYGYRQQRAQMHMNKAGELANARGIGWQNALNFAGDAMKAYALS